MALAGVAPPPASVAANELDDAEDDYDFYKAEFERTQAVTPNALRGQIRRFIAI